MKHTKRLLSLILAMALCLAMSACSSAEEKEAAALKLAENAAFAEAEALLAAGDYEGAIAAFSAIGRYQEISDKIAEAEKLRNESNMGFLFGVWKEIKDVSNDSALTLQEDGTFLLTSGTEKYTGTYTYENNTVTISQPMVLSFVLGEKDGITHLVCDMLGDFVPEANYDDLCAKEIEITVDNWQDYFEMKEVNNIQVNQFGEVSSVRPSIGIFLKEEYYSRLPENYYNVDISFELTYDEEVYQLLGGMPDNFEWDFIGLYELVPAESRWRDNSETGCTDICTVNDRRHDTNISEQSPFFNTVSAQWGIIRSGTSSSNYVLCHGATNIQVSRVIGTLKLFPE